MIMIPHDLQRMEGWQEKVRIQWAFPGCLLCMARGAVTVTCMRIYYCIPDMLSWTKHQMRHSICSWELKWSPAGKIVGSTEETTQNTLVWNEGRLSTATVEMHRIVRFNKGRELNLSASREWWAGHLSLEGSAIWFEVWLGGCLSCWWFEKL